MVNRKNSKHSRDAQANDMIHLGSDHRSVMEQFVFQHQKKQTLKKNALHEENNTDQVNRYEKPEKITEFEEWIQ